MASPGRRPSLGRLRPGVGTRRPGRRGPRLDHRPRLGLVIVAVVATAVGIAAGLAVLLTPVLASLEEQTLSVRFSLRSAPAPRDITIVGVDDPSFARLNQRWPFPRSWHGRVLEQLRRAGARAIFVDLQFTEPTTPTQDLALFHALGRVGGAVLATTEAHNGHSDVMGGDANLALVHSRAAAAMLPVQQGGVVEWFPYREDGLPTPAVAIAQRALGRSFREAALPGSRAYVDYQGPPGTFTELSYADVLRGHFDPALVRGRVIVLGATSPSLQDVHATPTASGELMSGPELQANAIWTMLHGLPLRPSPLALDLALVLAAALAAPLIRLRRPAVWAAGVLPGFAALYLVAGQWAFDHGVVLPILAPVAALAAAGVATMLGSHLLVTLELHATQREIVQRLARAAESRDDGTARHLERIGLLCYALARAVGFSRRDARVLRQASTLHDVGKIAIPDAVLLKPGKFDAADRLVMNEHAEFGAQILGGSRTELVRLASEIARTHHERWDGTGYPRGLSGPAIPLSGRICSICDVFDALISRRRYKAGWSFEAAVDEIRTGSATAFDPELVEVFLRIAPRLYRSLTERDDPDLHPAEAASDPVGEPVGTAAEPVAAVG